MLLKWADVRRFCAANWIKTGRKSGDNMTAPPRHGARPLLEICIDDADGVAAVVAGGADRIELCGALALGGLTPSAALVAKAVASGVPVHAMVRPRDGDFRYDAPDVALATEEIGHMVALGVAGVVVGAMSPTTICSTGISLVCPPRRTVAVSGASFASASIAFLARPIA